MTRPTALLIAGLAAAAAAAWWTFGVIRHAREDRVTLHVRNAPLASVVRRLERQTRERIVADANLDASITLNLDNAPLATALDFVAEQAGGLWRTTYAVHDSVASLRQLTDALQAGSDPARAGWTNLSALGGGAPRIPMRISNRTGLPSDEDPEAGSPNAGVAFDVDIAGPPDDGPRRLPIDPQRGRPGPNGRIMRRTGVVIDAGGTPRAFDLSPERLLLEERLLPRLGTSTADPVPATAEDARQTATRVKAHWATLYSIEASPVPGMPPDIRRFAGEAHGERTDRTVQGRFAAAFPPDIEGDMRRRRFDQLTRLTPEQRARQASHRPGQEDVIMNVENSELRQP